MPLMVGGNKASEMSPEATGGQSHVCPFPTEIWLAAVRTEAGLDGHWLDPAGSFVLHTKPLCFQGIQNPKNQEGNW